MDKNPPVKRQKGKNFKQHETSLLISLVDKYKDIIENKQTDGTTVDLKNKTWQKLAQDYNCAPTDKGKPRELRTCVQLKNYYDNYKRRVRKEHAEDKGELYKTGGGTFVKKLDTDGERLIAMLKPQFEPDVNEFDSASKYHDGTVTQESVNLTSDTSDIDNDVGDNTELLRSPIISRSCVSGSKESTNHGQRQNSAGKKKILLRPPTSEESTEAEKRPKAVASSSQILPEEFRVKTNLSFLDSSEIQLVEGNGSKRRMSQSFENSKLDLLEIEKKMKRDIMEQNSQLHERAMEKLACEIESLKQKRNNEQERHELEVRRIKLEIQERQFQLNSRLAGIE